MRYFYLVILISTSFLGTAQNNEDFGIWLGSDFSKKINKQVDAIGSVSLRTEENTSRVRQIFYQVGLKYDIADEFKTSISYRNNLTFGFDENRAGHRFIWDLSYKFKQEFFGIQIRNRLQNSFRKNDNSEIVERIRLKGDFKMQDGLKGYVFNEFFFQLNQSYRDHFKLNRFGFGMEYKIHKDLSVSLGYFRQSTKGYQTPEIFNGLNLEFEIDF